MAKFRFYQDALRAMFFRTVFSVQADNYDEALQKALQFKNQEVDESEIEDDSIEVENTDWLLESADGVLDPEEKTYSIELLDAKKNVIVQNTPIRVFGKYERVFCSTDLPECPGYKIVADGYGFVKEKTIINNPDDKVTVIMDSGEEVIQNNSDVYRYPLHKSKLAKCPVCGRPLFEEHNTEIDYPYYCPECGENFYGIEVQNY